jgi:hypothetical protein
MAADLTADLGEAAAEGESPEDVLGNGAFDPRRFAAAWATARGVTNPPAPYQRPGFSSPLALVLTVVMGVLGVGAGLALLTRQGVRSVAFPFVARVAVNQHVPPPFPPIGRVRVPPGVHVITTQIGGIAYQPLAWILLIGGAVTLCCAALCWLPWRRVGRIRSRQEPPTPRWS